MNGVIAVALATGQDTRALEAAAHFYARHLGKDAATGNSQYGPLATWAMDAEGQLIGQIELPVPVGVVGRLPDVHTTIKNNLTMLQSPSGKELGQIMAAIGLLSNFSALRALVSNGIIDGHMALHNQALGPPFQDENSNGGGG